MPTTSVQNTNTTDSVKAEAVARRRELIDLLTGESIRAAVADLRSDGGSVLRTVPLLAPELAAYFHRGMEEQQAWALEKWLILPDESVRMCGDEEFDTAPPDQQFSYNECLRKLPSDAYPVRALISAAESAEVAAALSEAYGASLTVKGVDMARYTKGHYLRRHSDTFDDRHFAMIFFLADGWTQGDGGELVVESQSGAAHVAYPLQGHVALLRISPGHHHQVCRNLSDTWVRCGLSVHFGAPGA
ncbi:2OG-Fe(II) oxygenase [Streptomyces sp. 8L]|uniref:2OG-Fe(II) oxygenase n=1 Tax=Streptomyces sp. 8L TaxID=2877242 RepID=UPI001CD3F9D2|nr:2OG-Fe(II) oxygenase [Streptomyces sp. 8L]MCA1217120.1 2OG-Fe(II) oxygenase [Streptomyces sp. 8L]